MNESEFKRIVLPLHKSLYACAFAILRDEGDAADCLQEAFTRLWEKRDTLQKIGNIPGYAACTVRNTAITMLSRRKIPSEPLTDAHDRLFESGQSPVGKLETSESMTAFAEIFSRLSPSQREVIELSSIGGLSHSEIVEATGFSDENVRVLLSRGRKRLKELLLKSPLFSHLTLLK